MRYHLSERSDEPKSSSSYSIWSSGSFQPPDVLKTIQNSGGSEASGLSEQLNNLYSLDTVSSSQKRKILDCEKGDFEERFRKIQRKRQLQRVAAKANLVIDDDDKESDEEDEIYEQMDWIEKENEAVTMQSWDSSEEELDDEESFEDIHPSSSVLVFPRSRLKEERRRLLRISMAKIRRVEDPESYLRRSVLINNTVKILQKDVGMNNGQPLTSTYEQESVVHPASNQRGWLSVNSNSSVIPMPQIHAESSFGVNFSSPLLNSEAVVQFHDQLIHSDMSNNPVHFHLAIASTFSSDKSYNAAQPEVIPNPAFCKPGSEEQRHSEASISPIVLKQPTSLHLFSSQPCGLQYRSVIQEEDNSDEYNESPNTSILDSVVYHSLVTSLET